MTDESFDGKDLEVLRTEYIILANSVSPPELHTSHAPPPFGMASMCRQEMEILLYGYKDIKLGNRVYSSLA